MDRRAASIGPAVRRGTLLPVAGAFLVFGSFAGAWAVAVIDIERTFGLSDAELGTVLAIGIVLAAALNAVGGALTDRWGATVALARSLAIWSALLVAVALAPVLGAFAVAFALATAAGGFVDVVMNVVAAAALSGTPGRLLRFHGLFNLGALLGAATTGIALELDASWRVVWIGIAVLGLVLALISRSAEPNALKRLSRATAQLSRSLNYGCAPMPARLRIAVASNS